jgi:phage terminase large subunit-like protein
VGFLAKHLNVQIGNSLRSDGWAGAIVWPRGVELGLSLDEILTRCEVVTVGLDGGGLDDLLGVAVLGRERGTNRWLGWAHGLISTIGAYRRKANAEDYLRFKTAGELTVFRFGHAEEAMIDADPVLQDLLADVPPAEVDPNRLPPDIQYVVDMVTRIRDMGLLAQVGVDAAGIGPIVDALAGIGVTQEGENLDAVRQGIALMGAIKTIERKLADGSFRHGQQGLLSWCVGNLIIVPTPTAMRVGRDEAGFGKVDPLMAMFNAAHLMCLNPEVGVTSIYDQEELWA